MIPKRIHRDLPGDAAWIIGEKRRQLTVYLANNIPADSPLEQHFVRQATRAWRRRHYPGPLVILPIAAGGIAWALRKMRQPLVAAGVVGGAAVTAFAAVTVTGTDQHPRPPAVVGAPPTHSPTAPRTGNPPTTPPPSSSPPAVTPSPQPGTDTPRKPPKTHPTTGRGNSSGKPGRTPPGHGGKPPDHGGTPPGKPPSKPPPSTPPGGGSTIESTCRLVEIHIGKLVRICL